MLPAFPTASSFDILVSSFSHLATDLPEMPRPSLGPWLIDLLYALAILFFLLGGIEKITRVFGKKPPLDEVIKKLATKEDLAALKTETHLRERGLEEQIAALRHEVRDDYNAAALSYQEGREAATEHIAKLEDKLDAGILRLEDKRSQSIGRLHEQLKTAELKQAETASTVKGLEQSFHSLDAKIDNLPARIRDEQRSRS